MSAFDRWLKREIAREGRAVYLEDALLSGRFAAYAVYRLRYFLGRSLVEVFIHIIEFTFLAFIFTQQALVSALLIRATGSFLNAWWWGALERMRDQVRELHREGKTKWLPEVFRRWFRAALVGAAGLMGLTLLWVFLASTRAGGSFEVFHLYVLAVAFRLALGILARTYHSAVYAIRRIYRPFFAIIGVELLGFALTLLLWPSCGIWSFPLAQFPTGVMAAALTFAYVGRVYRFLGLRPFSGDRRRWFSGLRASIVSREFVMAGLAYGFMRLDYVLVLSLLYGARQSQEGYRLFLFFYLIGPFVRSGYEWAQLFYFDLKRLELDLFSYLRDRFTRLVRRVALAVGVIFWAATCVGGTVLIGRNLGMVYGMLLLFFLVRSQLAFNQIRAFAERRYGILVAMGFLMIAGVWLARWGADKEAERLGLFAVVMVAALLCLGINDTLGYRLERRSRLLALPDWLARLQRLQRSVRLRILALDPEVSPWLVERIGRAILRSTRAAVMTQTGQHRIAWYELRSGTPPPKDSRILERGGGLIERIESGPYVEDGREAVMQAERMGIIPALPAMRRPKKAFPPGIAEIKRRFFGLFPNGVLYDAVERNPAPLTGLSRADRRQFMAGAIQYSKYFYRRIRRAGLEITTLCEQNRIRLIFGIPEGGSWEGISKSAFEQQEDARRRARMKWKSFMDRVNIANAIKSEMKRGRANLMRFVQWRSTALRVVGGVVLLVGLGLIPFEDRITGNFEFKADTETRLYAPLAGFVREIGCREGDYLKAGERVARFEVPDLASLIHRKEAEVHEIEAMHRLLKVGPRPEEVTEQYARIERAEAWHTKAQKELDKALEEESAQISGKIKESSSRLEFAEEEHDRIKKLYEAKVISLGEYERAERELRVNEAQLKQALAEERARNAQLILETESDLVDRARDLAEGQAELNLMEAGTRPELLEAKQAELDRARAELAYLRKLEKDQILRTPIEGIVTTPDLHLKEGTFLQEGELVCEIVNSSRLKVEIRVPEQAAARVKLGQKIELKVRALPFQTLIGTVDQIAPVVRTDAPDAVGRIYCWLDNPGRELQPGMSGYARVYLGTRPIGAVLLDRISRFIRREFWW